MIKIKSAQRFSDIVRVTRLKTPISPEDREFIAGILKKTKKYAALTEKENVEYTPRMIEISRGRRVRMICAEYLDESGKFCQIPISKIKAIEEAFPPKKKSPSQSAESLRKKKLSQVRSAFRLLIQPQIDEFRAGILWPVVCEESGKVLYAHDKSHVDHSGQPFVALVEDWLIENDLYYTDLKLVGPPTAKRLQDKELSESWITYHRDYACLGIVDASANMSKGAGNNWQLTSRWEKLNA